MKGFGSTLALRNLNVAAVGFALTACTVSVLGAMSFSGYATGPSTWIAGVAWALCMRSRKTVGRSRVRQGWLWSIPIAMLNAAFASSIFLATEGGPAIAGFLVGPIFGVVIWAPALLLTLLCFGLPIAWSQRAAERGLAGEERGELVVGVICTILAGFGALFAPLAGQTRGVPGLWLADATALLGVLCGATAAGLALRREWQRQRFVQQVRAGNVHGFRVDDTPEGRVLVRVTELGSGYRVANFTEELYTLDQDDLASRPRAHADSG